MASFKYRPLLILVIFVLTGSRYSAPIPTDHLSSTVLKLIPTQPNFIPAKDKQQVVQGYLNKLFGGDKVQLIRTDEVEFIDQGGNFESVACNFCGKTIDMEVWQNAMDTAEKKHFGDLTFTTPCCNKKTTLNDFTYHTPAGFAKFLITITDPKTNIEPAQITEVEKILGTTIRAIVARY